MKKQILFALALSGILSLHAGTPLETRSDGRTVVIYVGQNKEKVDWNFDAIPYEAQQQLVVFQGIIDRLGETDREGTEATPEALAQRISRVRDYLEMCQDKKHGHGLSVGQLIKQASEAQGEAKDDDTNSRKARTALYMPIEEAAEKVVASFWEDKLSRNFFNFDGKSAEEIVADAQYFSDVLSNRGGIQVINMDTVVDTFNKTHKDTRERIHEVRALEALFNNEANATLAFLGTDIHGGPSGVSHYVDIAGKVAALRKNLETWGKRMYIGRIYKELKPHLPDGFAGEGTKDKVLHTMTGGYFDSSATARKEEQEAAAKIQKAARAAKEREEKREENARKTRLDRDLKHQAVAAKNMGPGNAYATDAEEGFDAFGRSKKEMRLKREAEEEERRRIAEEEERRRTEAAEEAERKRIAAEEAERKRIAAEEAERKRIAAEEAAALKLQRVYRGRRGRKAADKEKSREAAELAAAEEKIAARRRAIGLAPAESATPDAALETESAVGEPEEVPASATASTSRSWHPSWSGMKARMSGVADAAGRTVFGKHWETADEAETRVREMRTAQRQKDVQTRRTHAMLRKEFGRKRLEASGIPIFERPDATDGDERRGADDAGAAGGSPTAYDER